MFETDGVSMMFNEPPVECKKKSELTCSEHTNVCTTGGNVNTVKKACAVFMFG